MDALLDDFRGGAPDGGKGTGSLRSLVMMLVVSRADTCFSGTAAVEFDVGQVDHLS